MDALFDILIDDNASTGVAVFGMSEPDVILALQQPWVSVDNDSSGASPAGILGQEHPHPRAYGTFPLVLRNMSGKKRNSRWKMPFENSPRCRRSACA
jgi:dihydroorotase/N-acyl-D-amino-acid deacylase